MVPQSEYDPIRTRISGCARDEGMVGSWPGRQSRIYGRQTLIVSVRRLIASRYFSAVRSMISRGSDGGGGALFQLWACSQSRTNCLSKLGGEAPGRYWSSGQKPDESRVTTSSASRTRPLASRPQPHYVS